MRSHSFGCTECLPKSLHRMSNLMGPVGLVAIGCRCARKVSAGRFWSERTTNSQGVSSTREKVSVWKRAKRGAKEEDRRRVPKSRRRVVRSRRSLGRIWRKPRSSLMRECRKGEHSNGQSPRHESEVRLWSGGEAGMASLQTWVRRSSPQWTELPLQYAY